MFTQRIFNSCTRSYATRIALIPADGIGPEVVSCAKRVLDETVNKRHQGLLEFVTLDAGFETFQRVKNSLPKETVEQMKTCDGVLFGAVSSPSHKVAGYSSPIIQMRKIFDLYANIRPLVSAPNGIGQSRDGVDMLIVRENTECLYVKQERLENDGEKAVAERVITKHASTRIAEMAFKQAIQRQQLRSEEQRKTKVARVTIVHKSNVLSVSDGLFRESCLEVAKKYPQIQVEEQLVDSMVYKMILQPQYYDVVVAPNLYGDILSDAGAALVGGLGLAPSANVGENYVLAEPVHGSAPDIQGKGIANPIATIRATALLIQSLLAKKQYSSKELALLQPLPNAVEKGVHHVLANGVNLTPDLGGKSTSTQLTTAIIEQVNKLL